MFRNPNDPFANDGRSRDDCWMCRGDGAPLGCGACGKLRYPRPAGPLGKANPFDDCWMCNGRGMPRRCPSCGKIDFV